MASNATILLIADAVVDELNGATRPWVGKFEARREYSPLYTGPIGLDQLQTLQVRVVPRARPVNELVVRRPTGSRGYSRKQLHRVDLGFQQKVADVTSATIDPLMKLVEDVEVFLLNDQHPLGTFTAARMIDASIDPWPATEHIDELLFTSIIQGVFEAYI